MPDVVFQFISGPLQGQEFTLENGREVVIGRSDEATLHISEDTVSRKHARIFFKNDEIVIEDLSKNGTYVNSRQIERAVLIPGDLVYIGHSVLQVVVPSAAPLHKDTRLIETVPSPARSASVGGRESQKDPVTLVTGAPRPIPVLRPATRPAPVGSSTGEHFRGTIGDIAMTDVLQLLASSRKTGILVLRSADMLGKIFVEKGQICFAMMDEVEPVNPQKVFFRLMRWTEGSFEFAPPERREFRIRLNETIDHLLLEAMHELDEINNLGPDLPSLHAEVELADPMPAPLKDLAAGDLDFIQLAMRHKMVRDILDHYSGTDFEGYTYLKSLAGRKFLVIGSL